MNFYKEELMDHYKNPRNYGVLEDYDLKIDEKNPSCGDAISLQILLKEDEIEKIAFTGQGCILSISCASILSELCVNKKIDFISSLKKEDFLSRIGISLGPTRLKCALLALETLKKGVSDF